MTQPKSNYQHYTDNEGKYQEEFDQLTEALMPESGKAGTLTGELIRAVNRLGHEYSCNGNENAQKYEYSHDSWEEEDWEDEAEITGVTEFYKNFLDLVCDTLSTAGDKEIRNICNDIEEIILQGEPDYSDDEQDCYDQMINHVVEYSRTHLFGNDKTIPGWYEN